MVGLVRALPYAVAVGFLALGLVAFHAWVRRRDGLRGALALSSGLLGATAMIERLHDMTGYRSRLMENLSIVAFLASGYALMLLRHHVMPLRPQTRKALAAAVGVVAIFGVAAQLPTRPGSPLSATQWIANLAIILAWAACVLEPTYRLWRTSKHRPAVQRARLRALGVGYGGILLVLTVAFLASSPAESPAFIISVNLVALLLLPVLYAAFVPPRWLRRLWRAKEEEEMQGAVEELVSFHPDLSSLGEAAVSWATRLVGAEGALITDDTGRIVASQGLDRENEARLAALPLPQSARVQRVGRENYVVRLPLSLDHGIGTLQVSAGPFTPLFGAEEVATLARYAVMLRAAMGRVRLVEQVRGATKHAGSLLEAASDLGQGVVVLDDYRVAYANDAYTQITGYSLEELRGLPSLMDLAAPEELESLVARAHDRRAGIATEDHYETALIRKDGRRVEVEVSVKEYQQAGSTRYVTLVRDIGERKRAERALRTAYERERQAVERLRSLDEMKNAFLTAVSHELRTPLTAVLGFARTLQGPLGAALTAEEREELLERIARGALKLERLLEDLLDLDRLHRNQLPVAPDEVDVASLVRRMVDESEIVDHRIVLDADPVIANVDPSKVERIVENLLTNAAKYTPAHSPIWVSVGDHQEGVLISVDDAGPGVPENLRQQIFRPFERGSSAIEHAPGVGIGLSLVTLFAELHGGRAWVEDGREGGASFRVWLPSGRPGERRMQIQLS